MTWRWGAVVGMFVWVGCTPTAGDGGPVDGGPVVAADAGVASSAAIQLRMTAPSIDRELLRRTTDSPRTRVQVVVTVTNVAMPEPLRFMATSFTIQTVDAQEVRGYANNGSCATSTALLRGDSVDCSVQFALPRGQVPRRLLLTGLGGGAASAEFGAINVEHEIGTDQPCGRRYGVANSFNCDQCIDVFCAAQSTAWVACGGRASVMTGQFWVREACTELAPVQAMCGPTLNALVDCVTTMCTAACSL